VTVRLFAAASEAAGADEVRWEAATVGELMAGLDARFGMDFARVSRQCSVLIAGELAEPATALGDGAVVDVMPPFAGG
jgi:molybdopterin converting factor small subunit